MFERSFSPRGDEILPLFKGGKLPKHAVGRENPMMMILRVVRRIALQNENSAVPNAS